MMEIHAAKSARCRQIARKNFGNKLFMYHPGMFRVMGEWGAYPGVSVTGDACALQCDHCAGRLLRSMIPVHSASDLLDLARKLADRGCPGLLVSGGCSADGTIPWDTCLPAIQQIKNETGLFISMHSGFVDRARARKIRDAGVDQVLIDVVGARETMHAVYHIRDGMDRMLASLDALAEAGIALVPHIIVGLHYGQFRHEYAALEIAAQYAPGILVIVVLMPLRNTPMQGVQTPPVQEIEAFFVAARLRLPKTPIALGCARPRQRTDIELAAVDAGFNRIALPAASTVEYAVSRGLQPVYYKTCCSWTGD